MWGAYGISVLVALCLVAGAAYNDHTIASNEGRALARVISVGPWRTTINYQDDMGRFHNPGGGVLFPGNLGEGQLVWVNYAKNNPELVKIQGRSWRLALLPAGSIIAWATAIAAVVLWLLGRFGRENPHVRKTSAAREA